MDRTKQTKENVVSKTCIFIISLPHNGNFKRGNKFCLEMRKAIQTSHLSFRNDNNIKDSLYFLEYHCESERYLTADKNARENQKMSVVL